MPSKTKITVHSDGTVQIDGKNGIVIESSSGDLELKGRQIKMTAQQGFSAEGTTVKISASTSAQFLSDGTNVIKGPAGVKIN